MQTTERLRNLFFDFVSWGMQRIPWWTVWAAERVFYLFPRVLRSLVDKYTAERILACVVGGELPIIPNLNGGDAILFYPLKQCVRYELAAYPEIEATPLFAGHILGMLIPTEKRLAQYHLVGYDAAGQSYEAGLLKSHSQAGVTKVRPGVRVQQNKIAWDVHSRAYLTSFLMVHTMGTPHAAGYSQKRSWQYPATKYLPHVVIPPDGTALTQANVSVMVMIVDKDAWVPEILVLQG